MARKSLRLLTFNGLGRFRMVIAVLAFLTVCPAWAAPVQKIICSVSGAPFTCTLTNPVQAGDLLVFEFHSSVAPTSVTDTLGSRWSVAVGPLSNNYILFAVAPTTGGETVRESTSNAWANGALFEYPGFSALDVTASRSFTAGTTQISSGSATTTVPGDLIVGWMFGSGWSGIQPGAGFTIEAATAPEAFEDRLDPTTGAVSATFTEPSWSGAGTVLMAAFKPSASATVQSNLITVGLNGALNWDSGSPIAGSVVISQILSSGTKQRLASLPIASDGTVTGTITFDASVQPLVLEIDLLDPSSNVIDSITLNSSSSSPLSQTTTTILLLMKSINAKVVLYQATVALKSIQVTPTLAFP
jgi:hypothetical protein